jgi:hypothetical protein
MRRFITSVTVAALVGASMAVPISSRATELPACSTVEDPKTTPCTGPTGQTGTEGPTGPIAAEPQYTWVWNGTAWEAEGYPYVWNGTKWVEKPPSSLSASNENTGPESSNDATASSDTDTNVTIDNDAAINNNLSVNFNTGGNSVLYNTNAGKLATGDVKLTVDLLNFINSVAAVQGGTLTMADIPTDYSGNIELSKLDPKVINAILAYYVGSIFELLAKNTNTGPESENSASASSTNTTDLTANQNAGINNNLTVEANTGNNTASYNTNVGDLKTGDIAAAINLVNIINSILSVPVLDIAMLNIFGSLVGNIILPDWMGGGCTGCGVCTTACGGLVSPQITSGNTNTGPESDNTASGTASNTLNITTDYDAAIGNNVGLYANTGGNTVGNNTNAGNLTTGSVDVQMSITDIINQLVGDSWFLVFVNVLGQWTGQILGINPDNGSVVVLSGPTLTASNATTGPYSQNNATASQENNTDITHNADAAINNNLNLDLNTGNNTVTYNTNAGNLSTGNISVVGNIVNIINQAITLNKRLFLGFVNIMGDWFGSIGTASSFPAVGGSSDETGGGEESTATVLPTAPPSSVDSTSSSVQGTTAKAAGGSGEIAEGEAVAFTPTDTFTMAAPEGVDGSGGRAWQWISLGLLGIGLALLIADAISRRRRAKI